MWRAAFGLFVLAFATPAYADVVAANGSNRCTYATSQWDVVRRTSSHAQHIDKPYAEVTADERDPNEPRCSVCREDQVRIEPKALGVNAAPFQVCHVYAADVRSALQAVAADTSFIITTLIGYRVGRTRGAIVDGLRTEWSNHSFGAALDINAGHNGLYGACNIPSVTRDAIATCHLRVGGVWDPVKRPTTTITTASSVYRAFRKFWRWGGEISGGTRDMMHFSPSGY
jgi:hypothetical protein